MGLDQHNLPAGASVSLTLLEGTDQTERHQVEKIPAYIGSGDDADVLLAANNVASLHARLVMSGPSLFIEDLGTGKTIKVNDSEVKRVRLSNGDIIEVGQARLLLQLDLPDSLDRKKSSETAPKGPARVWSAGFSEEFRDWFDNGALKDEDAEARAFRTGEELLIELSKSLAEGFAPSLLILDLRIPIVNGVNVAIAARAFELGYRREDRIPIVFLFDPPSSSSFEKVVRFCQPLKVMSPGESKKDPKQMAGELAEMAARGTFDFIS